MFTARTSVGLDVHARSVAAAAIDGVTGELVQAKLTPSYEHTRSCQVWVVPTRPDDSVDIRGQQSVDDRLQQRSHQIGRRFSEGFAEQAGNM